MNQWVQEGEHHGLEFKEHLVAPPYVAKAVSALANHQGGHVLFGVTDEQEVSGISEPVATARKLEFTLNRWLEPIPEYEIGLIPLWETGVAVLWLALSAMPQQVIYARLEFGLQAYIRVGDRSIPCGKTQLKLLEQGVRPVLTTERQPQWPKNEQKVWKQMFRFGQTTPGELSRRANISERRARYMLDRWMKKGLLILEEDEKPLFNLPDYRSSRKRS